MAKKDITLEVVERLAEYKALYPDTTVTPIEFKGGKSISQKNALALSKLVCHVTQSGLLQFWILGDKMFVYKSKEFLKVADGFKKGAKVRFHDPRTPDVCHESTMLADGMRYDDGIPFIWTEDSDADCFMECNTFAVYWRPVEEDKK